MCESNLFFLILVYFIDFTDRRPAALALVGDLWQLMSVTTHTGEAFTEKISTVLEVEETMHCTTLATPNSNLWHSGL